MGSPSTESPPHPASHTVQAESRTLEELITLRQRDIVARARGRAQVRAWPSVTGRDDEHGASVFLAQLADVLRLARTCEAVPGASLAVTAARHGAEMRDAGCTVAQVVHEYCDTWQTLTEMAIEQHVALSNEDYQTLNRCLDVAIAEAVTEHARLGTERRDAAKAERLGQAAHEMRDRLTTALLAYDTLKRGETPFDGHAGAVLGRSLVRLRDVLDGPLAQLRLSAGPARHERLGVDAFIEDIASTAHLHASDRGIRLTVEPVAPALAIDGDSQLLTSAVMNVLQNAFKYTPRGGAVALRAYAEGERVIIEVQDECGGIRRAARPRGHSGAERRSADRAGGALGLSIARRALRAHDGEVTVRNVRGHGCIFALRLPLSPETPDGSRATSGT